MNDVSFVQRAVSLLASKGVDTWVFGGWGEELRGLIKPRAHADLDTSRYARVLLHWPPAKSCRAQ